MWLVTAGSKVLGLYKTEDEAIDKYEERIKEDEQIEVLLDAELDLNYSVCIAEVERRFHRVVNKEPVTHTIETHEGDVIEFASDETTWSTAEDVKG